MFARQRWFILLVLALVLMFLVSPRIFASAGTSGVQRQSTFPLHPGWELVLHASAVEKCGYNPDPVRHPIPTLNTEPALMVISENWGKITYFCGAGYLGLGAIKHVNEIYNHAGAPAWFKWYRNGVGYFCAFEGLGGYQNFDPPVTITQIDYGDVHASDKCGN